MPLGDPNDVAGNIAKLRLEGKPMAQALAIALHMKREHEAKKQVGHKYEQEASSMRKAAGKERHMEEPNGKKESKKESMKEESMESQKEPKKHKRHKVQKHEAKALKHHEKALKHHAMAEKGDEKAEHHKAKEAAHHQKVMSHKARASYHR